MQELKEAEEEEEEEAEEEEEIGVGETFLFWNKSERLGYSVQRTYSLFLR